MKRMIVLLMVFMALVMMNMAPVFAIQEPKDEMTYILILKGTNDKVNTIKAVREILGMDLATGKAFVEAAPQTVAAGLTIEEAKAMNEKLVNAGAITALTGKYVNMEAAEAAQKQNTYKLVLCDYGNDRANTIRILRQLYGLDLMTAKQLTDRLPATLGEGMTYKEAYDLATIFAQAGANAAIQQIVQN